MHKEIIQELYAIGAVKFGHFTLKSGIQSPIYIDLRLIVSYPQLMKKIESCLWEKIRPCSFELICGVPYTALPIATALSLARNVPMVMRRKEAKNYGTKRLIEGVFQKGETCLIIEDLITSGMSIFETIQPLEDEGMQVKDVVVILDREQGGKRKIEEKGYRLHSLFTLSELLSTLQKHCQLPVATVKEVQAFIASNQVSEVS